jgi:hypothetical protein
MVEHKPFQYHTHRLSLSLSLLSIECIQLLLKEPLIHQMMDKKLKGRVTFAQLDPPVALPFAQRNRPFVKTRLEDESLLSTDVSSIVLTPLNKARAPESEFSTDKARAPESEFSTDVSSVVLTPLNKARAPGSEFSADVSSIMLTPLNKVRAPSQQMLLQIPQTELRSF